MNILSLDTFTRFAAEATKAGKADFSLRIGKGNDNKPALLGTKELINLNGGEGECNKSTLKLFRELLGRQYGAFGEHAFDMALGERLSRLQPLTARDIQNVMSIVELGKDLTPSPSRRKMIEARFLNEVERQAESHPLVVKFTRFGIGGIGDEVKRRVLAEFNDKKGTGVKVDRAVLTKVASAEELEEYVSKTIAAVLEDVTKDLGLDELLAKIKGMKPNGLVDYPVNLPPEAKPDEPVGLRGLAHGPLFNDVDTSVEDRIRSGNLSSGMRVNTTKHGEKLVLEKLKTNGVEPGFEVRRDWSSEQTMEMLTKGTVLDKEARKVLKDDLHLVDSTEASDDEDSEAFEKKIEQLKEKNFTKIRDIIVSRRKNYQGNQNTTLSKLCDRHIVKLDYNEGDRSPVLRRLRRPTRQLNRGFFKGFLTFHFTLHTQDYVTTSAVREALGNDITRVMGIPAQELEIVRGKFPDGRTKLILKAKYAEGYSDLENGFLKDGRVVKNQNNQDVQDDFGKYKAGFLLLADWDAVGTHGQNKGVRDGKFFAVDPGHSLEGNGKRLKVNDDFSFDKKTGVKLSKYFANYSVFDDTNRSEKLKGWLKILEQKTKIDNLFNDYLAKFPNPKDRTADKTLMLDIEPDLMKKIHDEIIAARDEFNSNFAKMSAVFKAQVDVHDAVVNEAKNFVGQQNAEECNKLADGVIDTIENFERATSPVRIQSKEGQVDLKHLEVVHGTRKKWTASYNAGKVSFSTQSKLSDAEFEVLKNCLGKFKDRLRRGANGGASLEISVKDDLKAFLAVFTEGKIREERMR